jgi:hypothetical protein
MSEQIKSLTCPEGSTPTTNKLYCKAGDIITSPEEYAGEHVGTCGSTQSSAKGVTGFKVDAGEMACIREGFKNLWGEDLGVSLPKEYFYYDSLSNIEGSTCMNTVQVTSNVAVVKDGIDVVKECLEESGNGNVDVRVESFKKFVDLHTPPETHGMKDWLMLAGLFGLLCPLSGILTQHFYQKWFGGPKGPPPAPPATPGGSAPKVSPAPESSSKPAQFSVPPPSPETVHAVRNVGIGAMVLTGLAAAAKVAAGVGTVLANGAAAAFGLFIIVPVAEYGNPIMGPQTPTSA